ncbi:hypothetical protein [Lentzea sp. NPDC059081]|uniref:hypothetical protein n=1 Tax=Lentzea sp. NPDC059081 TaxID=3346719 RepID=UPI00367D66AF
MAFGSDPLPPADDPALAGMTVEQLAALVFDRSPDLYYEHARLFDAAVDRLRQVRDDFRRESRQLQESWEGELRASFEGLEQRFTATMSAAAQAAGAPGYGIALRQAGDVLAYSQRRFRDLFAQQVQQEQEAQQAAARPPVEGAPPPEVVAAQQAVQKKELALRIVQDLGNAYRDIGTRITPMPEDAGKAASDPGTAAPGGEAGPGSGAGAPTRRGDTAGTGVNAFAPMGISARTAADDGSLSFGDRSGGSGHAEFWAETGAGVPGVPGTPAAQGTAGAPGVTEAAAGSDGVLFAVPAAASGYTAPLGSPRQAATRQAATGQAATGQAATGQAANGQAANGRGADGSVAFDRTFAGAAESDSAVAGAPMWVPVTAGIGLGPVGLVGGARDKRAERRSPGATGADESTEELAGQEAVPGGSDSRPQVVAAPAGPPPSGSLATASQDLTPLSAPMTATSGGPAPSSAPDVPAAAASPGTVPAGGPAGPSAANIAAFGSAAAERLVAGPEPVVRAGSFGPAPVQPLSADITAAFPPDTRAVVATTLNGNADPAGANGTNAGAPGYAPMGAYGGMSTPGHHTSGRHSEVPLQADASAWQSAVGATYVGDPVLGKPSAETKAAAPPPPGPMPVTDSGGRGSRGTRGNQSEVDFEQLESVREMLGRNDERRR